MHFESFSSDAITLLHAIDIARYQQAPGAITIIEYTEARTCSFRRMTMPLTSTFALTMLVRDACLTQCSNSRWTFTLGGNASLRPDTHIPNTTHIANPIISHD
jgi:hypothetical protein